MASVVPEVGARFMSTKLGKGQRRVWELVESLPVGQTERWPSCERHTLRCIEESGFTPEYEYGVGCEMNVEDAWFTERTDMARVQGAAK